MLTDQAQRLGAKPYFRFQGAATSLTYESLVADASAIGGELERRGCQSGEMAALFLPNGIEFVQAWFASLFAGMADAPINAEFRKSYLQFALNTTQPKVMFTDAAGLLALQDDEVIAYLPKLRLIVCTDGARLPDTFDTRALPMPPVVDMRELLSSDARARAWETINPAMLASVRYTSGTTGPAKGAMQSHLHILNKSREHLQVMEMVQDDVVYSPFPLHHNLASINGMIGTLQAGATFHSALRFSASAFWKEAHAAGATLGHILTPLIPTWLAQPPADTDRQHALRYLWMGWPHAQFEERFKTRLVQVYALGEVGVISYRRGGRTDNATGEPIPAMEVRIVDELDRPLPPATSGEITVRPRMPHRLMLGYMNNLPATLRAFRNLWFHTGDQGQIAADGQLHFEGRIGDTIRRRGVNISSEQIENELLRCPQVLDCAVFGVPSPLGEEDIHACVVWNETNPLQADASVHQLIAFLQERLPKSYLPRYIEPAPMLPKTNTGKVRKGELRERRLHGRRFDREANTWIG